MMLPLTPSKLFPRFLEAKRQGLKIDGEDGIYRVNSFKSKPGGFHTQEIRGNEGWCSCPAVKWCTHLALAAAEHSLPLWRYFRDAAADEFNRKRLEAQRAAVAQICEQRRRAAERNVKRFQRANCRELVKEAA